MDFHELRMDQEWYRFLSAFRKRDATKAKIEQQPEPPKMEEQAEEKKPHAA